MISRRILGLFLIALAACTVTVKEIKNVTTSRQLLYSGTISLPSSSSNLFFLFYGIQGVTDRTQLAGNPTLVVFGSPSSSSQYLNFAGMGPFVISPNNASLVNNSKTPSTFANLMFIDFLGNGFSFAADEKQIPSDYASLAKITAGALADFASNIDFGKGKWILVGEETWIRTVPSYSTLSNVVGIVSLSTWSELNAIGKYYGLAGVELKLFNANERSLIETAFTTCFTNLKNGKYREAHSCYEAVLDLVESKGNNHNLYNIAQNDSLIPHFPLVQYYLSQPATVALFSAPTNLLFEQQNRLVQANNYVDEAKNYTKSISDYLTANPNTKILFLSGANDFVTYSHAVGNWTESELSFPESATYVKNVTVDGNVVGRTKGVNQVQFVELNGAGHYVWIDKQSVVSSVVGQFVQKCVSASESSHLRHEEEIVI